MVDVTSVVVFPAASFMATQKLGTAELLFRCAQQMGLSPVWLAPRGVFAIMVDGRERYVNLARSPLNSAASVALARNKYVTRCILERRRAQNIPFTLPRTQAKAEAFLALYGTIIAKPISGAGARDIHIITKPAQLAELNMGHYLLEQYIVGKELRYLLLNGAVVGVHRSEYGTSVAADRQLKRISYPPGAWDPTLVESSLHIADILDLRFAAVDYLVDAAGQAYVLEVNTMPGFKWFHAPSAGPAVDIARLFLESIVDKVRFEGRPRHSSPISRPERTYQGVML